ncbi:sigma-54 dependent transcriptional regulator [Neisseria sp. 83E34]|uniref:sigma-54-dependent transcriptional regulator n=1 Tax=Neisseria sp. 83E34 TaxID=1692264 RepID=UPI0006CE70EC|nr:sigma-54 dependent transcriptional regulator [Neisseria sp. 83E34]KPN71899.1 type 4 fimbriae expression regulatory protein [Neisseria sp. 83E34]
MTKHNLQQPVLVVDDEADIRDLMEMTLMKMGLSVDTAVGVVDAKSKLDDKDYSLVLTDMRMPDGSGLEVVQYINELMLDTPVAVITAFGNADQAVEALKAGAFDYLQKPITLSQLRSLVKSAVKVNEPVAAVAAPAPASAPAQPVPQPTAPQAAKPAPAAARPLSRNTDLPGSLPRTSAPSSAGRKGVSGGIDKPSEVTQGMKSLRQRLFSTTETRAVQREREMQQISELSGDPDMPRLLGASPQMVEVRHLIRRLAGSVVPVYISGESGSGKEQAARSIHELSARREQPFIAVNCGAIPENLMESEFFGYKKGSFTGADSDRMGFFQHANGGTLFLDEVADLPLGMQVKLLRAIQEKAVRRIGDAQETKVDVRIICATHKNLETLVETGAFRQDLYYRLNVVTLHMPPLREMREDLGPLIFRLLNKYRVGETAYKLSPKAQDALLSYSYPGNFRELENILERAVALTVGNIIQVDDLQIHAPSVRQELPVQEDNSEEAAIFKSFSGGDVSSGSLGSQAGGMAGASTHEIRPEIPLFVTGQTQIQDYLDEVERSIILQALQETRFNRTQAAKLLGISFRSMRYRMERLAIE